MLMRTTASYVPAQLAAPAIQLIALFLWARVLTPAQVGEITIIFAIQEGTYCAFVLWWAQYVLRSISSDAEHLGKAEVRVLVGCLVAQLTAALLLMTIMFPLASGLNLLSAGLYALARSYQVYSSERFRALSDPWNYSSVQIGGSGAGVALGAIGAHFAGTVDATLLGLAVGNLLFTGAASRYGARPNVSQAKEGSALTTLRLAAVYGVPAAASAGLTFVTLNFQRFVSEALWGIAFTGFFSLSLSLGIRMMSVVVMVVTAGAFPIAVREANTGGLAAGMLQLSKNALLLMFFLLPALCILGTFGATALSFVLPGQYAGVLDRVFPLALALAAVKFLRSHTVDQAFLLAKKTGSLAVAGLIEAAASIALALALMPYGYSALLVGPVVACSAVLMVMAILAHQSFGFSLPLLRITVLAAVAGLSAGGTWLVGQAATLGGVLFQITASSFAYLLFATWLSPEGRRAVRNAMRRPPKG
ncbi:hypothetical protein WG902_12055 [Ramlibacter sp. PS3R-8]|uniref:lipopolysaccharide biosynthesis protein n=1 Tax=Ramlibacter sp. PS3R-8 TaxID=3133437 RepID=UPI0030AEC06C